ncbi:CopM family metallochaperone [Gloeobacter violaceus]|uniref:Gll0863 protein n=1 Tax=Gloeobacter violaceus (strain ATCC 29082 / PCC 7421) TaxID=251221 RepID=Q7NMA3_GLOVI|nr:DUF305 domain-containing protein [Gloeobacter violaceus]BAC88804.1 gll0863 [Gloeobacter violaceus PCC 7421]
MHRPWSILAAGLWLAGLGAFASPGGSHSETPFLQAMEDMHRAMAALPAGGDTDRDFAGLMLLHHRGAIDMARAQLLHGKDPALRRLAQEIVIEQQAEIELMRLWLARQR